MSRRSNASRPETGGWRLSHKVRVWEIRTNVGRADPKKPSQRPRKTYTVRWVVETKEHQQTFATRPLADAFRSTLLAALRAGEAFDVVTGKRESELRQERSCGWYEHACNYVRMKWPAAAPKTRTGIAEAMTTVTLALVADGRARPDEKTLRTALYGWAFVPPARAVAAPPSDQAAALDWLARHTVDVSDLADPLRGTALTRAALDALAKRLDGAPAKPTTIARKRTVFYNSLQYAIEEGLLAANPIDRLSWTAPKSSEAVDRRVVANSRQVTALLCAVALQPGVARRLVALFACMYYAALRPAEALDLREENIASLPQQGWGELILTNSSPRSGKAWTNSGRSRDRRGLKHRPDEETRHVPVHPILVAIIRAHIAEFGVAPDGRLFVGPRGGSIGDSTYAAIWKRAREIALTPAEARSPLAGRPYDLRHACVSTWLNAGVGPAQVAEWAGHSVAVLLRVYAKCIDGGGKAARRKIEEADGDA